MLHVLVDSFWYPRSGDYYITAEALRRRVMIDDQRVTVHNMIDCVSDLMAYRQQHNPPLILSMSKGYTGLRVFSLLCN